MITEDTTPAACPACGRSCRCEQPEEPDEDPPYWSTCPECDHLAGIVQPDAHLPEHLCASTIAQSLLDGQGNEPVSPPGAPQAVLRVRQLVEEQRDRWDIQPPDGDARWQQTLAYARALWHEHDDDPLILSLGWYESVLCGALRFHAWQDTPRARQYLRAALAGVAAAERPGLRRTALVVTVAYGTRSGAPLGTWRSGQPHPPFLYNGSVDQRVENGPGWDLTPALLDAAKPVMLLHRAMLEQWFAGARLPPPPPGFVPQPGRPALGRDYLDEVERLVPSALDYADRLAGKPMTLARRDKELLDHAYGRVYSRRDRAQLTPRGFPGGKTAFRAVGWARLRQVVPTLPPTPPAP
jgi:hypothetical protein